MFQSMLQAVRQSLFTGPAGGSGRTKYTFEELRALSDVLNKNQVVTEANRALVVETIRSIAEFMIWGDQNEPRIFDFFLENNIMHYLHRVLQQPANRTGDVAKQVLQTLSIIIQNIRSETGTYFLFSNNHINNIVEIRFDFEDEEVLGYYISFLKTISLKLNVRTVQFFFDRRDSTYTFPLYSEAVKFAHHKEGMVRAGVRTLTLNVYSVLDPDIQEYVVRPPVTAYFADFVAYIADQVKILDKRMAAAEGFSAQVLSSLDSQIAEVEDMVSYLADVLNTGQPKLAHLVAEQLWVSLVGPFLLRSVLEHGTGRAAAGGVASTAATTRNAAGGRLSGGGGAPGSPTLTSAFGAATATPVRPGTSLYVLERLLMLITYTPLLHNLALALLDPRVGHPSCRPAFTALLRSEDHRAVPAALRCLVALVHNRAAAPEVLALLGLVPRSRAADLHAACVASDCAACRLRERLPPLPEGAPAAGAAPDALAEEAQPVVTGTAAPGAPPAAGVVFGYHVVWTRLDLPPVPMGNSTYARHGHGDGVEHASGSDGGGAGPHGEDSAAVSVAASMAAGPGPGSVAAGAGAEEGGSTEGDLLGLDVGGSGSTAVSDGIASETAAVPPVVLQLTPETPLQYSTGDPGPLGSGDGGAPAGSGIADLLSLDSPDRSEPAAPPAPMPKPPPAPPPPPPPPPPPLPEGGDLLSPDDSPVGGNSPVGGDSPLGGKSPVGGESPVDGDSGPASAAASPPASAPPPHLAPQRRQPPPPPHHRQDSEMDLLGLALGDLVLPAATAATAATTANVTANATAVNSGSRSPVDGGEGMLAPANTLASAASAVEAIVATTPPAAASTTGSAADLLDLMSPPLEAATGGSSSFSAAAPPVTSQPLPSPPPPLDPTAAVSVARAAALPPCAAEPAAASSSSSLQGSARDSIDLLGGDRVDRAASGAAASLRGAGSSTSAAAAAPAVDLLGSLERTDGDVAGAEAEGGTMEPGPGPARTVSSTRGGPLTGPPSGGPLAGLLDMFPQAAAAAAAVAASALTSTTAALVDPLSALVPAPADTVAGAAAGRSAAAERSAASSSSSGTAAAVLALAPDPLQQHQQPLPLPPAPPSPPRPVVPTGPPCPTHARPAVVASTSGDLMDALFSLLSMQLLPVPGLWNAALLLGQLYPRVEEVRALEAQQAAQQQSTVSAAADDLADLLGVGDSGNADALGGTPAAAAAAPVVAEAQVETHPLDPSSTAGWACVLSAAQREALRVAAVSAASAVLDEVGGMWTDALVAMLALEWPLAYEGVSRASLRTGAEQLLAGPHLYPRQTGRGLSTTSGRNDQGLSGSAVAALHSFHAVSRLVALLHLHDLLARGATSRRPPPTCPMPPGGDVEAREWDVLEGQEVELHAGSAIPCIVSFSPGQERRVYFAAAGPALRQHDAQALLADSAAQAVVLHSSPAVVLADPAPTRLNAGIALSTSPLLGCDPTLDKNVPKWLHVHVRPSVRGLLRLLRSAAGGRKGGLLAALRHLVDGHWVLAFPDAERASNARTLVEQSAHKLRALYCELLSPVLGAVME